MPWVRRSRWNLRLKPYWGKPAVRNFRGGGENTGGPRMTVHAVRPLSTRLLLALQQEPCSKDTGTYCRARAKLPAAVLKRLAVQVGQQLEAQLPEARLWKGRHAK